MVTGESENSLRWDRNVTFGKDASCIQPIRLLSSSVALKSQLDYWKQHLAGLTTLQLPTDRSRPAGQTFCGASETTVLPDALTKKLHSLGHREGVTPFMLLLAAFKALLHRYTGQRDIVVGAPIANRNLPEIDGLIGFFANTLVLRTEVSGDARFRELLKRVRETALDAYENQDLPFEHLVDELEPVRDASRNPLFQVTFALQNVPMAPMELAELSLSSIPGHIRTTRFDLELHVRPEQEGLSFLFIYNTDLFDGSTIRRMQAHYGLLLESVVADPNQRVSQFSLMRESERHQVLEQWNATRRDYPRDASIQELFEQQVRLDPEAIAVTCRRSTTEPFGASAKDGPLQMDQLAYGQLNERANQLAHYLKKLGVGLETVVGICIER